MTTDSVPSVPPQPSSRDAKQIRLDALMLWLRGLRYETGLPATGEWADDLRDVLVELSALQQENQRLKGALENATEAIRSINRMAKDDAFLRRARNPE